MLELPSERVGILSVPPEQAADMSAHDSIARIVPRSVADADDRCLGLLNTLNVHRPSLVSPATPDQHHQKNSETHRLHPNACRHV